jgi:4-hydroxybenzoate polyprenyltransferase
MGPGILAFWNQFLGLPLSPLLYTTVFGTVWFGYLVNHYFDVNEDKVNGELGGQRWAANTQRTLWLAMTVFALTTVLALSHNLVYGALVVAASVAAALYSVPIPLGSQTWRIKAHPHTKNLYAALHWSITLLALAYTFTLSVPDHRTALICLICFFMNFFIELLWDVRDKQGDMLAKVHTIPTVYGLNAARVLLHAINAGILITTFWGVHMDMLPRSFWLVGFHFVAVGVFVEVFLRLPAKRLASHLYLLYVMLAMGAIWVVSLLPVLQY